MARILPFQGIHYNPDKINSFAEVTTPPYDVISPAKRDAFHERHPHNVVRLILGKATDTDTPEDNPHTRAAACYRQWLASGVLEKAPVPALYLTAVEFPVGGQRFRRYGLIARVALEPFEKRIVLPHERTFSKVKSERLELLKRCHANFSPIFALYTDPGDILKTLVAASTPFSAEMDFTDDAGHRHLMWRLTDPDLHRLIEKAFQDHPLFIADGHHRYETALNYRNWLQQTQPNFNDSHPANFIMMSLSSVDDPGLVILPAHRILTEVPPETITAFLPKAAPYFDMETLPAGPEGRAKLADRMAAGTESRIGAVMKNDPSYYVLTLKPGTMDRLFHEELPPALRDLDVTVLTRLIFMEILGFDQQKLDNEKTISYTSEADAALDTVESAEGDMGFILKPTSIAQVRRVAEEGLIMPRKTTYFYPKVLTGQVLNDLLP
jgi:uncharacterized protein (DUF1015 family)